MEIVIKNHGVGTYMFDKQIERVKKLLNSCGIEVAVKEEGVKQNLILTTDREMTPEELVSMGIIIGGEYHNH